VKKLMSSSGGQQIKLLMHIGNFANTETGNVHWQLLTNKTANAHWQLLTNKTADAHWQLLTNKKADGQMNHA
jgi:hypothetical protein